MSKKFTEIKAGYRLTVTSWENDGDNYNTKSQDGLTKEESVFLVELITLFKSRHNRHGLSRTFGNMYDPSDKEIEEFNTATSAVVSKHNVASMSFSEYFQPIDLDVTEYLYDLGLTGGEQFTRVMESYTVEFIPCPIRIEDVTEEFK